MATLIGFGTTQWSVVIAAGAVDPAEREQALAALCESYWYPLYSFARRLGHNAADAEDLTQSFLAHLIEGENLGSASPGRGRFRTFLRTSLRRFAINDWRARQAQKRGGGAVVLSLDFDAAEGRYNSEPGRDMPPDKAFDRQWALTVLESAMTRLESEQRLAGKAGQFALLKPLLAGDDQGPSYADLAETLGMRPGALRTAVHRLRQRYAQLIRVGVMGTLDGAEGLDDEIALLFSSLKM